MPVCMRCGAALIETQRLNYCPKCLDSFLPGREIDREFEEEETFDRVRALLTGGGSTLQIWPREPGTGCTTALTAIATHQVLPYALPDFTAFCFDAQRAPYRLSRDFRQFLIGAIRAFAPRYDAPDADAPHATALMLAELQRQLTLRAAQKQLLIFLLLPDALPTEFLRSLPRGRSLPPQTTLIFVCTPGQADALHTLFPRADCAPPILRTGERHTRAARALLESLYRQPLLRRARGRALAEQALAYTGTDYHRIYLLEGLHRAGAVPADALPDNPPETAALRHYAELLGDARLRDACALAAMAAVWPYPLPPTMLPGLCGKPPAALADALEIPELLRITVQNGAPVAAVPSESWIRALDAAYPSYRAEACRRITALAVGSAPMPPLPAGGLCRFFAELLDAAAKSGDDAMQDALRTPDAAACLRRTITTARRAGRMTPAEEEEVWDARIWATRSPADLLLHLDACRRRQALHEAMDQPGAVVADLSAMLRALMPVCTARPDGRRLLADLYAQRAEWNLRACRARSALEDCNRAVRFAEPLPGAPLTDDETAALVRLLLARAVFARRHRMVELESEDLDRALTLLHTVPGGNESAMAQALQMRAELRLRAGWADDVQADLDRASALLPALAEADRPRCAAALHRMQGELYDQTGDPLRAAAAYGRQIALLRARTDRRAQSELAAAYGARAAAYARAGNFDCAYADRSEAIAVLRAADAPGAVRAEAYLARAALLHTAARDAEAAADCGEAAHLLEPSVGGADRRLTQLCAEAYRLRIAWLGDSADVADDRRRLQQLRILLSK